MYLEGWQIIVLAIILISYFYNLDKKIKNIYYRLTILEDKFNLRDDDDDFGVDLEIAKAVNESKK